MKKTLKNTFSEKTTYWLTFFGKALGYLAILIILVYIYHYSHATGGDFIYNEF